MKNIVKIEKLLKCWRLRTLKGEGKVPVVKAVAVSKIIHFALIINIPVTVIK